MATCRTPLPATISATSDVRLDPHFEDYVRKAFKPLGVYVDFWQPAIYRPGAKRSYASR
jgi:hypothetical protein